MVLVAALMIMALLSVLCIAGISSSTLEVKIAAHDRDAKQAFYLCEAGLEKAKYEAIKGWGRGDAVASAVPGAWDFSFDGASIPDAVKACWTTDDTWQNFMFVDKEGKSYQVLGDSAAGYEVTCQGSALPTAGRASFYYQQLLQAPTGSLVLTPTGTPQEWQAAAAGWAPNEHAGRYLVDEAGTRFNITGNTATVLTIDSTAVVSCSGAAVPPSACRIETAHFQPSAVILAPNLPNPQWTYATRATTFGAGRWYLADASTPPRIYRIDSVSDAGYSRVQLNLSVGASVPQPTPGNFQLVSNPWLAEPPADLSFEASGSSGAEFPASLPYGTVNVWTVPAADGRYQLRSRATVTGTASSKEIAMDMILQPNGGIQVTNWREAF